MRAAGCLLLLLCGCAARIDSVERRLILPEGASRYEMAPNQAFAYPVPLHNATPAFPAHYAVRELTPTTLCVSFVVDVQGQPADVAALAQEGCSDPMQFDELSEAAISAVSGWRFEPAMFCDYPDAATRDRDWNGHGCAGEVTGKRAVPVSLAYAFTFEIRHGKPNVGSLQR